MIVVKLLVGVHRKGAISLPNLLSSMKNDRNFRRAGALGIFIGVVRGDSSKGGKVENLELEAYEEKANETLRGICRDLKAKEGVVDVQIHHFLGEFDIGEDLVYVVVAGAHRQNVFPVLEEAVERYKKEAPIFKKEQIIDEKGERKSFWVAEHEDRQKIPRKQDKRVYNMQY